MLFFNEISYFLWDAETKYILTLCIIVGNFSKKKALQKHKEFSIRMHA